MELLEKLDILSNKINALMQELKREKDRSSLFEAENVQLKEENSSLRQKNDAVKERIENLIARL